MLTTFYEGVLILYVCQPNKRYEYTCVVCDTRQE